VSIDNFIEAIRMSTGGAPLLSEIVPGKMIRFGTNDRKSDKAGWCKLFDDGEGGVFGCWRQGISETWQASSVRSPEEEAAFQAKVKQVKGEAATIATGDPARMPEKIHGALGEGAGR
jgi:putative DNA primase/helicase